MAQYAIMRLRKIKTLSGVDGLGKHMERERETPNADEERTPLNERLTGTGDWTADVQARLAVAPVVRKNAVVTIEVLLGASPEWWKTGTPAEQDRRRDAWRDLSMAWLHETFGEANVVASVMHRDESSPHISALVVPIDGRGRLNARGFIGGPRTRMVDLQTSYAQKVAVLGLERGITGSVATHQEVQRWYAQLERTTLEVARDVSAAVQIEPPQTVVGRPKEYARQQHDRVVQAVAPQMEALAQKARQLTFQVERQELQIAAQAEREKLAKSMLAHLRQVDLRTVMGALGGALDRDDWRKWHLGNEVISIAGEKFQSLTRQQRGFGAIDLVMHVRPGYDFEDSVVFISRHLGADVAVVSAARYAQNIAEREQVRERTVWEHDERVPRPHDREPSRER